MLILAVSCDSASKDDNAKLLTKSVVRTEGITYMNGKTDIYRIYEYVYNEDGTLKEKNVYHDRHYNTGKTELVQKTEYFKTDSSNVIKCVRTEYQYGRIEVGFVTKGVYTTYDVYHEDGIKLYSTSKDPNQYNAMIVGDKTDSDVDINDIFYKMFGEGIRVQLRSIEYSDGSGANEFSFFKNDELVGFGRLESGISGLFYAYENGRIVKEYYSHNGEDVFLHYTYRYDENGNCTERKQYVPKDMETTYENGNGMTGVLTHRTDPFYREDYFWDGIRVGEEGEYIVYTDVYTNTYVAKNAYQPPKTQAQPSGATNSGNSGSYDDGSVVCMPCSGTGSIRCIGCSGTGQVFDGYNDYTNQKEYRTCPGCYGTGTEDCPDCNSDGYVVD